MASTIHKHKLNITDKQTVKFPRNTKFLYAREQHEAPCIWFMCDPDERQTEDYTVAIIGTGHPAPEIGEGVYLGSAHLQGGNIVFHIFIQRQ